MGWVSPDPSTRKLHGYFIRIKSFWIQWLGTYFFQVDTFLNFFISIEVFGGSSHLWPQFGSTWVPSPESRVPSHGYWFRARRGMYGTTLWKEMPGPQCSRHSPYITKITEKTKDNRKTVRFVLRFIFLLYIFVAVFYMRVFFSNLAETS